MRKLLLKTTGILLLMLFVGNAWGQTTLNPGDIMLVTVNADSPKNFDFVPLVDLTSGTVISFTDNAWTGTALKSNEGIIIYTASAAVSAGSVISYPGNTGGDWTKTGSFNPSGSGDNILVYQGASTSPSFILGVGWAIGTPWISSGTVTSNNSYVPSSLSAGANTIVSLGSSDDYQYKIATGTSGTKSVLLANAATASNFNGNNSTAYPALSTTFTITTGTTSPAVSTVAASNINVTAVDMNGNVTSDGGATVTDRGECYKTTSPVTISDNKTSASTAGNGTYSVNITSLTAETQYYFAAYATNSVGTTLASNELSFWTLSTEPTGYPSSFTATTSSSTQINLTFNAATSLGADGYIILRREDGTNPDATGVTDATAPGSLSLPSGTTLVTTITNNSATAYNNTGLSSVTQYNYAIIPYNYNGTNNETYNYKTDGTVPTANATTGAPAAEPVLGDLKITEVNSTSAAYASYAEIYNTTSQELSLDKVDLEFYNDGSATASSTLHLTGTINPNSYIVIARKSADFNTAYGFSPDFTFNGMSINGGADGLILRHDNNGILDHFNDAPSPTVSWTDNHLFYRFDYASDGSSLANDWDDAGLNKHGTPKAANQLTWKTSGTTDWHTGSNWSNGDVPSKGVDVIIPSGGNQASVSGTVANPASCKNLTINSNAVLTIPVSKYMTVYGNLTNNNGSAAGLVVQSTSAGNGSLIVDGTITGNATVQRYIAKFSSVGAATGWHEIGCPVSSFSVSGTDWDPTHTGTSDDLYYWDESQNLWMNYRASTFNFSKGNGYLAANDANLTHVFTGVLNNTDVTISGLSYTSGKGNGWHLLGNPFPSAIKWNDGNWTLTNVGALAEIWNGTSASYTTISANGIIPSTNGFFVEVTSGTTGTVTIPASARTHYATNNNKSALATKPKETLTFKITDDANSYSDKSTVGFRPEATKNWDVAFDAHKILSFVKESPQIWTVSDGQKFLVNYLPEITSSYDVPLYFRAGINTVYHLTIKGADSFENTSLVLEDLQTGQKIDLSQVTSYDFTADKGDDTNRFVLHINGITAVPNVNKTDGIQVFAFGNTVYLHGQQSLNGRVSIFNTLGQQVYEGVLNGAAKQQIRLNQRQGIYFVRLEENNHVLTRKVFIK